MFESNPILIIESLKNKRADFIAQRELIQNNFNQLTGAIYACDLMIKDFDKQEDSGEKEHVEVNNQRAQETA